ncbi:alpha/beta fold hydrolase [Saccharothrix sp. S26]|nr:alpha/beta fold hydrolase [Saccharothrix sp. S26]
MLCFPHAGGGASYYRPWAAAFPADVELWVVQYPGREDRMTEARIDEMGVLVDEVSGVLLAELDDLPLVLFGHSMGAAVAHEVARVLAEARPGLVRKLVVSGRMAPKHEMTKVASVHLADDDGLVAHVVALGGTSAAVFAEPELRDLLLPVIRNDYRLIETYRPTDVAPLDVPVTAIIGSRDARATVELARPWSEIAGAGFALKVLEGGHFYLTENRDAVLAEIVAGLPR